MTSRSAPRWVLSFVDLCLVLLGFFVMLHAQAGHQAQLLKGLKSTFGGSETSGPAPREFEAAKLFEPGEAILKPAARAELATLGHSAAASHARIRKESVGTDRATSRFDGWELAAARAAAVARALRSAGVPETAIDIIVPPSQSDAAGQSQRIQVIVSGG